MIYTVEIDFTNPAFESEWADWYHGNLALIVTVPGVETAQRLEKVSQYGKRFLAIYNVTSPDVFSSEAYRAIGGGGTASSKWREWIDRRRNLSSGIEWIPAITGESNLILTERDPAEIDLPNILFARLTAEALARSPLHRYIAIATAKDVNRGGLLSLDGVAVYRPMRDRHVSERRQVASP